MNDHKYVGLDMHQVTASAAAQKFSYSNAP